MLERVLPRHMEIVRQIDRQVSHELADQANDDATNAVKHNEDGTGKWGWYFLWLYSLRMVDVRLASGAGKYRAAPLAKDRVFFGL